jgi:Zn-dependent peptidase ImmA (M78 family)/transcriptional regulator with XRE-family HTH domain
MPDTRRLARRLRHARLAARITQDQAAEALGVSRPAVSLIESGQRAIAAVELATLASRYGTSISALLLDAPEDSVQRLFRLAAPIGDEMESIVEAVTGDCRQYAVIEEELYGQQQFEVPEYPHIKGLAIEQGEWLARQERRRLGQGHRPIRSMVDLLESLGVKLFVRSLGGGSLAGCYLYADALGPCVAVNADDPPARRRYTMAHEYAHFLVDRGEEASHVCNPARRSELREMRANAFAAAFLLPEGGVRDFLQEQGPPDGRIRPEHVVGLMHHFGVSYDAVTWRLLNLDVISRAERKALANVPTQALASALGYEDAPGADEPSPSRLRAIAVEAWRREQISTAKLAELLGLRPREIARLFGHPEPVKPRVERAPTAEPDWL